MKVTKSISTSVRFTESRYSDLRELATNLGITVGALINVAVAEYLASRTK